MREEDSRLGFARAAGQTQLGPWLVGAAAVLAIFVAIGVLAWRAGIQPTEMAALGYPGVFLMMLISGAGTFFPAPSQATVLAAGALWNPILVGLAAGLGNASGELVGYAAGRAGSGLLQTHMRSRWWLALWRIIKSLVSRYGFFTILAFAMIPNPLFDIVGLLAGSLAYPVRRFWLACALGNCVKYIGMAYLGGAAVSLFQ